MLAVRALVVVALMAAGSSLPAAAPDDGPGESGVSQWNEPAIAIGMFSGGRRRRSGDVNEGPAAPRQRRQDDLYEDLDADLGLDLERRRAVRQAGQAAHRGIESPFGQTSDTEDRVRRLAQDESQEDNGPVDNDHFASEEDGKRSRRASEDAYFDDEDGDDDEDDTIDVAPPTVRRKRQVVGVDSPTWDDKDVYLDLDHSPMPVWARGIRDGRVRRQLDASMTDDDQPDYLRQPRGSSAEDSNAATATPAAQDGEGEADGAEAIEDQPRVRRAPQLGRFDGFVLTDLSGRRGRRDASSEDTVVKTLLQAPFVESSLGELPLLPSRWTRQVPGALPQPAEPAAAGPVTYLVPLAAPQPSTVQATNGIVPEKVLQIYTAHEPAMEIPTTTTTTPAPLGLVQVPESAVSGYLVPGPEVHVDVLPNTEPTVVQPALQQPAQWAAVVQPAQVQPAQWAAVVQPAQVQPAEEPAVVQPALVQPAEEPAVVQPALVQPAEEPAVVQPAQVQPAEEPSVVQPDATQATNSPQQAQPFLALEPGPVLVNPLTTPQATPAQVQPSQEQQSQQAPSPAPQHVPHTAEPLPQAQDSVPVISWPSHAAASAQPSWPSSTPPAQEPPGQMVADVAAQPSPLEWFPAQPTPFQHQHQQPQDEAPPRQYFDMNAKPCDSPRWASAVPIVEKTIQVNPDGSYMYSYETADGVRVAEAGVLKEVPLRVEEGAAMPAPGMPTTTLSNSVQGGYSYTAPDGTYFSLRYVADENGFRPVLGESQPTGLPPTNGRAAVRFDENK